MQTLISEPRLGASTLETVSNLEPEGRQVLCSFLHLGKASPSRRSGRRTGCAGRGSSLPGAAFCPKEPIKDKHSALSPGPSRGAVVNGHHTRYFSPGGPCSGGREALHTRTLAFREGKGAAQCCNSKTANTSGINGSRRGATHSRLLAHCRAHQQKQE